MKYILAGVLAISACVSATAADPTAKYEKRDFSAILLPKTEFLGFIGPNYQRLTIHYTSITQDRNDPRLYHVKGTSEVKKNRCTFEGTITLDKITLVSDLHTTGEYAPDLKPPAVEGRFNGKYELRENPAQKDSGVFAGGMTLDWYINTAGELLYDDLEDYGDNTWYKNNQYTGTWTGYAAGAKAKTANWGEYRIPDSQALDVGDDEFKPSPKYRPYGWQDYKTAGPIP